MRFTESQTNVRLSDSEPGPEYLAPLTTSGIGDKDARNVRAASSRFESNQPHSITVDQVLRSLFASATELRDRDSSDVRWIP